MRVYTNKELENGVTNWDDNRIQFTIDKGSTNTIKNLLEVVPHKYYREILWKSENATLSMERECIDRLPQEELFGYSAKWYLNEVHIASKLDQDQLKDYINKKYHYITLDGIAEFAPKELIPVIIKRIRDVNSHGIADNYRHLMKAIGSPEEVLKWFFEGNQVFYISVIRYVSRAKEDLLGAFSKVQDKNIREHAASRAMRFTSLKDFIHDEEESIRVIVAQNLKETELLEPLMKDPSEEIRKITASRIDPKFLSQMVGDSSVAVRFEVVKRIAEEEVPLLANDRSKKVRNFAAQRMGKGSVHITPSTRKFKDFNRIRNWNTVTPSMIIASFRSAAKQIAEETADKYDFSLSRELIPDELYTKEVFVEAYKYEGLTYHYCKVRDEEMMRKYPETCIQILTRDENIPRYLDKTSLYNIPEDLRTEEVVDTAIDNQRVWVLDQIPEEFLTRDRIKRIISYRADVIVQVVVQFPNEYDFYYELYTLNNSIKDKVAHSIEVFFEAKDENPNLTYLDWKHSEELRKTEIKEKEERRFLLGVKKVTYALDDPIHICMGCIGFNANEKGKIPTLIERSSETTCMECTTTFE